MSEDAYLWSTTYVLKAPEASGWKVELLGGVTWYPPKGSVPNAFWRWTQFVMFGFRWQRDALDNRGAPSDK